MRPPTTRRKIKRTIQQWITDRGLKAGDRLESQNALAAHFQTTAVTVVRALRELDAVAFQESRSRSEFLRAAARAYIQRKRRWAGIFAMGRHIAESKRLVPADVAGEIRAYRQGKATRA